jgi:hypothetical protein
LLHPNIGCEMLLQLRPSFIERDQLDLSIDHRSKHRFAILPYYVLGKRIGTLGADPDRGLRSLFCLIGRLSLFDRLGFLGSHFAPSPAVRCDLLSARFTPHFGSEHCGSSVSASKESRIVLDARLLDLLIHACEKFISRRKDRVLTQLHLSFGLQAFFRKRILLIL